MDYAAEAIAIGHVFQQIAQQMGNYLQTNIQDLVKDPAKMNHFTDDQNRILSYANTFYSLGDRIAFDNDEIYFAKVDEATAAIDKNIATIKETDKWISFAGAVITLAASICTGNGSGIISSAETIIGAFHVNIPGITPEKEGGDD